MSRVRKTLPDEYVRSIATQTNEADQVQRLLIARVPTAVAADVPVHVARAVPYHVPTVLGGDPVWLSRIPKHVPLRDIRAAAQVAMVGVVMTLTRGLAVVDAAVVYTNEGSNAGSACGHGTVAAASTHT
jgi:hypothetical protein